MRNPETICELLYNATLYPVYLHDSKTQKVIAAFPHKALPYPIPDKYLSTILLWNKPLLCYQTDFGGYYGFMKLPKFDKYIVIGPVSSIPYNAGALHFIRTQSFCAKDQSDFAQFLTDIPAADIQIFVQFIILNYYILTGNLITMDDMIGTFEDYTPLYDNVHQKYLDNLYHPDGEYIYHSVYSKENRLMSIVEHGDVDKLNSYSSIPIPPYPDIGTSNNNDYLKYIAASTINLACRAAIRGGLSITFAFQITESYMAKVISQSSSESIAVLISQAIHDLTDRVASLKVSRHSDDVIMDTIRYIQENFTQPITVADVAAHVGYNRSHLARRFQKELQFDISSFIRRCRLERSKELLIYSDKSISEISSYLCFSSQGHFQNAFKKAYGMTPLNYRKNGIKQREKE